MVYYDCKGNVIDCKTMDGHIKSGHLYQKSKMYTLHRQYAHTEVHGNKMRRTIIYFIDSDGKECNKYIVNYKVNQSNGTNISFSRAHGNSKCKDEIFIRTNPTVLKQIENYGSNLTPKQVVSAIQKEAGGSFGMTSACDIVRNRTQVYNKVRHINDRPKSRNTGKVKMTDFSKVLMMLQQNDFVKDVSFSCRNKKGKSKLNTKLIAFILILFNQIHRRKPRGKAGGVF